MLTLVQIREVLTSGVFDSFIGEPEGVYLDCKRQPYRLTSDRDKLELAKDVAGFANAEGGIIVVGLGTRRASNALSDVIDSVHPLSNDAIDVEQYQSIIRAWIVPSPAIVVEFHPTASDQTRGIFSIEILHKPVENKPFLIAHLVGQTGRRIEMVFGYTERVQANTLPASVQDMHKFFKDGKQFADVISARFDAIEAILSNGGFPRVSDIVGQSAPVDRLLSSTGHSADPFLTLLTYATQPAELRTIFSSASDSIRSKLAQSPRTRPSGWSLPHSRHGARIVEAELVRIESSTEIVDLYRSGLFVFAGIVGPDFYCWSSAPGEHRIKTLALIEAIYNYVNFYQFVIDDFARQPDEFRVGIDLRNLPRDAPPYMAVLEGRVHGMNEMHRAPADSWYREIVVPAAEWRDPGALTFKIVREIFLWFGIEDSQIPYVQRRDGTAFVDPAIFPEYGL